MDHTIDINIKFQTAAKQKILHPTSKNVRLDIPFMFLFKTLTRTNVFSKKKLMTAACERWLNEKNKKYFMINNIRINGHMKSKSIVGILHFLEVLISNYELIINDVTNKIRHLYKLIRKIEEKQIFDDSEYQNKQIKTICM